MDTDTELDRRSADHHMPLPWRLGLLLSLSIVPFELDNRTVGRTAGQPVVDSWADSRTAGRGQLGAGCRAGLPLVAEPEGWSSHQRLERGQHAGLAVGLFHRYLSRATYRTVTCHVPCRIVPNVQFRTDATIRTICLPEPWRPFKSMAAGGRVKLMKGLLSTAAD